MSEDSRIKDIIYKRKNGENVINDYDVLSACKTEQSRDIIDNARLGSYDKFGNYIIIPEIKNELIDLPKLIYNVKSQDEKVIYDLRANIPVFGDVYFKLTFSKNEAVLSLVETVYREANQYLETYNEPLEVLAFGEGALSEDIIMRSFNIYDNPGDFGKNFKFVDLNGILTRKVYLTLLSKELKEITKFDEHAAFDKMIETLKNSGEYGKKVLTEFLNRIKDRPAIFEINMAENYNKAVNEILLSSLDIATTKQDKDDYETRQAYLKVLNARNENIEENLLEANNNIDEDYVKDVVEDITEDYYLNNRKENETIEEFFNRIKDKKSVPTKRKLEKPVLKQGKEEKQESKTKEEKIKELIDKKEKKVQVKRTEKGKKLSPAKSKQKTKKLKAKKAKKASKKKLPSKKKIARKKAKKSLGKGKLKSKKKRQKKAKSPEKAKFKGQKLQSSKEKPKQNAKKAQNQGINLGWLIANRHFDRVEKNDINKVEAISKEEKFINNRPKQIQKEANNNANSHIKKITDAKQDNEASFKTGMHSKGGEFSQDLQARAKLTPDSFNKIKFAEKQEGDIKQDNEASFKTGMNSQGRENLQQNQDGNGLNQDVFNRIVQGQAQPATNQESDSLSTDQPKIEDITKLAERTMGVDAHQGYDLNSNPYASGDGQQVDATQFNLPPQE